jgi:hypothetical protein
MLHAGLRYEQAAQRFAPFSQLTMEDRLSRTAIARLVRSAVAMGRESTVIVNNKAEGSAPLSVVALAEEIAGEEPGEMVSRGEQSRRETESRGSETERAVSVDRCERRSRE